MAHGRCVSSLVAAFGGWSDEFSQDNTTDPAETALPIDLRVAIVVEAERPLDAFICGWWVSDEIGEPCRGLHLFSRSCQGPVEPLG